jgi:hypothetical protein
MLVPDGVACHVIELLEYNIRNGLTSAISKNVATSGNPVKYTQHSNVSVFVLVKSNGLEVDGMLKKSPEPSK